MYTIVIDMTHIDDEWTYTCESDAQLRTMIEVFALLGVDVIEVLRDGESMMWDEYQKILAG